MPTIDERLDDYGKGKNPMTGYQPGNLGGPAGGIPTNQNGEVTGPPPAHWHGEPYPGRLPPPPALYTQGPGVIDQSDLYSKPLSEKNKLPWQEYLDPSVTGIAGNIAGNMGIKGVNLTAGQRQYLTQGGHERDFDVDPEAGGKYFDQFFKPHEMGDLIGAGGSRMDQALSRRYEGMVKGKLSQLGSEYQSKRSAMVSGELARAADIYGQQQAIRVKNFQDQMAFQQKRADTYNAWNAARGAAKANLLATIIGVAGTVIGGYFGGPAGAAAGGAAGGAAGNEIGGGGSPPTPTVTKTT